MFDLLHDDPSAAWEVVGMLVDMAESDEELCDVGAGPLEDLVVLDDDLDVRKIEDFVSLHPNAIKAYACVWGFKSRNRTSWRKS